MKKTNRPYLKIGAQAGFIVVLFTTAINVTGRLVGILPEAMDLSDMASFIDRETYPIGALILGIIVHIVIGIMTGIAYSYLVKSMNVRTGIAFMMIFWLLNMLIGMPLAGRGWFGINDGSIIPASTFILHLIFGICMGLMAKRLMKIHENS